MKGKNRTLTLVQTAILAAVILLMAFTPLGYFKTPGLSITLIVVPVAVGAVLLGPKGGAFLGLIFGVTSFSRCFGMDTLGTALFSIDPVKTFILCIVPRILVGWLTALIYQALKNTPAKKWSIAIASLCCPLLNTVLYMSCLVLFFYQTEPVQQFVTMLGAKNPLAFIILFVGINAVFEAAACLILSAAVSTALLKINRRA